MGLSTKVQIKRINEILNKNKDIPDIKFIGHKYIGKTLEWVYYNDPNYLIWVYKNVDNLSKTIKNFIVNNVIEGDTI